MTWIAPFTSFGNDPATNAGRDIAEAMAEAKHILCTKAGIE